MEIAQGVCKYPLAAPHRFSWHLQVSLYASHERATTHISLRLEMNFPETLDVYVLQWRRYVNVMMSFYATFVHICLSKQNQYLVSAGMMRDDLYT